MSGFFTALLLLTSIPLPVKVSSSENNLASSVVFFPFIGLFIALMIVFVYWIVSLFVPHLVSAAVILVMSYLITGGMHADGCIDTADGLFSGQARDKTLEIMRDSRVGAMGVISFVCVVLLKFSLLCSFNKELLPAAIIVSMVCSRWAMAAAIVSYPYARKGPGLGRAFAGSVDKKSLFISTLVTVLILAVTAYYFIYYSVILALVYMTIAAAATYLVTLYFYKKLGGLTGDTYGALNEVLEVIMLLTVLIVSQFLFL